MAAKVKKNDRVVVLAGRDKGKIGRVLKVIPKEDRLVVEGVNIVKRHTKPSMANPNGGVLQREAAIHVSNVAVADPKTDKPTRVGFQFIDGVKVRVAKKSGEKIDV